MAKFPKPKRFIVNNPEKYIGDHNAVISRSSWETKFMVWLDSNKQVLAWNSEETVIPYISPKDNRPHRYFLDFKAKIVDNNNVETTYIIEIKPDVQTRPPKPRKQTKAYLNEVLTWGVNEAKWTAAEKFAKEKGMKFVILTEHHLGIK